MNLSYSRLTKIKLAEDALLLHICALIKVAAGIGVILRIKDLR